MNDTSKQIPLVVEICVPREGKKPNKNLTLHPLEKLKNVDEFSLSFSHGQTIRSNLSTR